MVSLRKANAYSKRIVVPYTRISKRKNRSYIKVVPPQKIVKFSMGEGKVYAAGKFPHKLTLVTIEAVQIRHNALESCRQYINKGLDKILQDSIILRLFLFLTIFREKIRCLLVLEQIECRQECSYPLESA